MTRRCAGLVALALSGVGAPLGAQQPWRSALYPYVAFSAADGFWAGGHYGITSPIAAADAPELNAAAVSLDASASTAGSYALALDARAPARWSGWRVAATLTAARENRLGFYGLGNDSPYLRDSVTTTAPYFYRVSRSRAGARATLQRHVWGPLRLLIGAGIERSEFRTLPGPSVFGRDAAAGQAGATTLPFTDKTVRGGAVLDTRDNELDPERGIRVDALLAQGTGYTRTTGTAQVYARPAERLVLAARVAAERVGGTPPLSSDFALESSERVSLALGGYSSLRGYYDARFVGPGKLLGGVEVRYAVVRVPSVLELKLVAFYDVGRVFAPGESWRLTSAGLHHGTGGEVALRFLRNSLVVVGVGAGPEGALVLFGTQWSY